MDNIVSHYFHLRRLGMVPADAWGYACAIANSDEEHFA